MPWLKACASTASVCGHRPHCDHTVCVLQGWKPSQCSMNQYSPPRPSEHAGKRSKPLSLYHGFTPVTLGRRPLSLTRNTMHMALEADAIHPSFLGGNPSQLLIQIPFKKYFLGSVRWLSGQKCSPHKLDNLSLIPRIHVNVEKTNWFYKIVLWLPHAGHGAHMCTHIYTVIIYKCKQGWIDSSVVKSIY